MNISLLYLEEVDSTNTYGVKHFDELPDGALVVSSFQTAGRGRQGRKWHSPAGINIYASLVVKSLDNAFLAGAMAGLAVLETVKYFIPESRPFLKWPNDVYVQDCKIAGILCESAAISKGRITGLVAGMGLNVNLSAEAAADIGQPATSMKILAGNDFDLKKVIKKLENSLKRCYITGMASEPELFSEWKKENRLIGQTVELTGSRGEEFSGLFKDIAPDGAMLLELDGKTVRFDCGDVRIRRESIDWNTV